ncbi:MAG: nitroreductase family protein [Acidimicrobiaceae bacterium]|nr:nitroreductase family protein [Acidimicrobiaceae bacterium]
MKLNLSIDEVLSTTRSVRKRLDFDRPVEREIVEECLNLALQAPTGGNSQGWHWIIVEDVTKRKALADIYKKNFAIYASMPGRRYEPADPRIKQMGAVRNSAMYLAEEFYRAPLMLIPCIEGRTDNMPAVAGAGSWGSLLPAVWSFMLALRSRGLGSAWTTIHMMNNGEKQAAELLGIPFDKVMQGGLFPIAYTIGTDFKPAKRLPLEKVLHWDKW